jgi:hypothetical protein
MAILASCSIGGLGRDQSGKLFYANAWTILEPVTGARLVDIGDHPPKRDSLANKSDYAQKVGRCIRESVLALNGDPAYKMNWSGCAAPYVD